MGVGFVEPQIKVKDITEGERVLPAITASSSIAASKVVWLASVSDPNETFWKIYQYTKKGSYHPIVFWLLWNEQFYALFQKSNGAPMAN